MNTIGQLQQDPDSNPLSPLKSYTFSESVLRNLRKNPAVAFGIIIVVSWIILAVFAPVIATKEPLAQEVSDRLQAPNQTYILGSDELGVTFQSRFIWRSNYDSCCPGGRFD
jgi:ABC-type dipeptide/oligopeptide/nickel transport system permease subunit